MSLLCKHFPGLVDKRDVEGCTALLLAARAHPTPSLPNNTLAMRSPTKAAEDTGTIDTLLDAGADIGATDDEGNTCLHYASAWGNLKAIRVLIQNGADPMVRNHAGWSPEYYSITMQAEVYYRNLVAEWEKRRAEEGLRMRERQTRSAAGMRVVTDEDEDEDEEFEDARDRAASTSTVNSGLGPSVTRVDSWR